MLLAKPVNEISFSKARTRQIEAVAWEGQSLLLVNEGGRVFYLSDPFDKELKRFP